MEQVEVLRPGSQGIDHGWLVTKTDRAMGLERLMHLLAVRLGGVATIGVARPRRLDYRFAGSYKGTPLEARLVLAA